MLNLFPRNSKHVRWFPCKDIPIFLEEKSEREFLFFIKVDPTISHLIGVLRIEQDFLGLDVIGLNLVFGRLLCWNFRSGLLLCADCLLDLLLVGQHQLFIGHLTTLHISIERIPKIRVEGDYFVWAWHLEGEIWIMRDSHEFSHSWSTNDSMIC